MNSASAKNTYITMQSKLLEDDEATCYLVEAISTRSKDENWLISLDKIKKSHKKIRRISIDRFYEIVFNDSRAFFKLCKALPTIIDDVLKENKNLKVKNTVFEELLKTNSDILSSLYLLAFSTYEGFTEFENKKWTE